ncbi:hypothetical protein GGI19_003896 [Coemansia pectinata]|uniref:Uncharacterized protein n=1 Tax=Coemansia pectinata TaxID=1052879 RepID=A0A9W8GUT0_9FUNG|nr:hypothetical protein GGI19_003896 [Coemansia pectinata]
MIISHFVDTNAEEEYNAVMVEIRKSTEAKEATIAVLEEKAEKQRSNLRDRLTRVLSEDAVKKILAPTKPMAGQTRNEENDGPSGSAKRHDGVKH